MEKKGLTIKCNNTIKPGRFVADLPFKSNVQGDSNEEERALRNDQVWHTRDVPFPPSIDGRDRVELPRPPILSDCSRMSTAE